MSFLKCFETLPCESILYGLPDEDLAIREREWERKIGVMKISVDIKILNTIKKRRM